jgi:hypothetical protein
MTLRGCLSQRCTTALSMNFSNIIILYLIGAFFCITVCPGSKNLKADVNQMQRSMQRAKKSDLPPMFTFALLEMSSHVASIWSDLKTVVSRFPHWPVFALTSALCVKGNSIFWRPSVTVVASAELLLWRAPEAASTCLCDLDAPHSPEPLFFYEKREQSRKVSHLKCIRTE